MDLSAAGSHPSRDEEALGQEHLLTRRERLRMEREARRLSRPRTRLRLTAVAAVVAGVLVWLTFSWLGSSHSTSEDLPEAPELDEGDRTAEQPPSAGEAVSEPADEAGGAGEGIVVVHVAGAVESPGVVELPAGSRVHEALEAAGGAQGDAAPEALNLAAEVHDGALVTVPTQQEVHEGEFDSGDVGDNGQQGGGESQLIDLNRAEASALEELPGIGPALAERIVTHREQHGPFESLEDLAAVSGIGPAILADVEDLVAW